VVLNFLINESRWFIHVNEQSTVKPVSVGSENNNNEKTKKKSAFYGIHICALSVKIVSIFLNFKKQCTKPKY
jgi:hypothetical protein